MEAGVGPQPERHRLVATPRVELRVALLCQRPCLEAPRLAGAREGDAGRGGHRHREEEGSVHRCSREGARPSKVGLCHVSSERRARPRAGFSGAGSVLSTWTWIRCRAAEGGTRRGSPWTGGWCRRPPGAAGGAGAGHGPTRPQQARRTRAAGCCGWGPGPLPSRRVFASPSRTGSIDGEAGLARRRGLTATGATGPARIVVDGEQGIASVGGSRERAGRVGACGTSATRAARERREPRAGQAPQAPREASPAPASPPATATQREATATQRGAGSGSSVEASGLRLSRSGAGGGALPRFSGSPEPGLRPGAFLREARVWARPRTRRRGALVTLPGTPPGTAASRANASAAAAACTSGKRSFGLCAQATRNQSSKSAGTGAIEEAGVGGEAASTRTRKLADRVVVEGPPPGEALVGDHAEGPRCRRRGRPACEPCTCSGAMYCGASRRRCSWPRARGLRYRGAPPRSGPARP